MSKKTSAKKQYSAADREKFHKARVKNPTISEGKQMYSRHWLDGFNDPFAQHNLQAVSCEIDYKKGRCSRGESIMLNAYKNGLQAQLDVKK